MPAFKESVKNLLHPIPSPHIPWYLPLLKDIRDAIQEEIARSPYNVELLPNVDGATLRLVGPKETRLIDIEVEKNGSQNVARILTGDVRYIVKLGDPVTLGMEEAKRTLLLALEEHAELIRAIKFLV